MKFVELDRYFFPIKPDKEIDVSVGHAWGKQIGGWLDWNDLLKKHRVILLAEAECGKTEEFRNVTEKLSIEGKAAFFVSIEELADEGFEASLDPSAAKVFEHWKTDFEDAYFFLDSLDEARLNHKRFDSALKKFARAIAHALDRSRIFVSCRVTDWKGAEDLGSIQRLLPVPKKKLHEIDRGLDAALLDPIFSDHKQILEDDEQSAPPNSEPTVVRLAPLDATQQRKLAKEAGIVDVSVFQQSVWQNGLDNFAERPGDIIDLAEYWKEYRRFGSLWEMTEYAVLRKLSVLDPYRPDNSQLTVHGAREGAERIAAAMTLGKTFTLRAPGQEPDPALSSGALDPRKILPDWDDAKRNALLRRGMFAPATYGRIRFHHRSTQEYLTANWFNGLLQKGGARSDILRILFSEVYGVNTVAPSLRPAAAWLARSHDDIRDEILKRDPLMLIQHGDPGSLPLETRQQLLRAYAEKHEAGDIANDDVDHRALWMFAHPDLADVIHEVWGKCTRYDFRGDLLRLIREGQLDACADLAMDVAQDKCANDYHRVGAVEALTACKDNSALKKLSDNLMINAKSTSAGLASNFARELFPEHLNVDQLISLIVDSKSPDKLSTEGFGFALEQLWSNCPTRWQRHFVTHIADLALSKPFVDSHRRISNRYRFLAKHFEPIAHQLISELGMEESSDELVHLLMAIERVDHLYSIHKKKPTLRELVISRPELQRALLWADVEEVRANRDQENAPIRVWQIHFIDSRLWNLTYKDLAWLHDDLLNRPAIDDRRIALSAIVSILISENAIEQEVDNLRKILKSSPILMEDLENYLKPDKEDEWEREHRLKGEKHRKEQAKKVKNDKESWRLFRNELVQEPSQILDTKHRFRCIQNLDRWLRGRTKQEPEKAARQWRLIEDAFDRNVAEAYRDAMKALWRATKPERPRRPTDSQVTTKLTTIYSFAAVGIEAEEDPHWAELLKTDEAELAAKHACLSEQGYPDWLDDLLEAHFNVVAPIIEKEFQTEWKSKCDGRNVLLYHYSNAAFSLFPGIASRLFEIIVRGQPSSVNKFDHGLRILQRIDLSENQRKRLQRLAHKRFKMHEEKGETSLALRHLALLFEVDSQEAFQAIKHWIESSNAEVQVKLAVEIFGVLFNRSERGLIVGALKDATTETLKQLVLLAYKYVRTDEENVGDESISRSNHNNAEEGLNTVLSILLNVSGADAYGAVIELAGRIEIGARSHRFRQLARGMAERDAEKPPWIEEDIVAFEKHNVFPIKTGDDLFKVIQNVLDDIRYQFELGDASSKRLLAKLADIQGDDEESVQNWLAEQMSLRANGRYHVHREPEVAKKNEPDIIISATSGLFEIAIEVKQADSWSPNELQHALTKQLAEDYLKIQARRHGVLFLTDHGRRAWRNPKTQKPLSFYELIGQLSALAKTTNRNSMGEIRVCVFGLDAKSEETG